jgi:hypothetical protein
MNSGKYLSLMTHILQKEREVKLLYCFIKLIDQEASKTFKRDCPNLAQTKNSLKGNTQRPKI